MRPFEITVSEPPTPEQLDRLRDGLSEHSRSFVQTPGFQPLGIFASDVDGTMTGGATGKVNWNWLHVNLLWVAPACRGQGLGSVLLERLEAEARERGCTEAHVDTFSYQAGPFYERHGYVPFGRLENYPTGQSRLFLRKTL